MTSFIDLKNVKLTYNKGKDNAYQALSDINLDIKEGEFAVIFGPSGCGKSSLLNIIAGLEDPDEGTVMIDNKDLLIMKEKEKVEFHCTKMGMIFQSYNLISTLDVLNNVALPQMFNNKRKKERDTKALAVLERFGIEKQWNKVPSELSGGQQQRIGIARAIINDPQIILADEPIGNLDTNSANNVMEILGNLNRKEGKTIILVSHNPENIIWGSHIIYMKDGKIEKEEIKSADQISKVETEEQKNKSNFDTLLDRLSGLSPEQIALMINPLKAKMLTESFLIPYEKNQTTVMEKNIEMFLARKIDTTQALSNLDRDVEGGGAGLDYRAAKKFIKEVSVIVDAAKAFNKGNDINQKVLVVLDYLVTKLGLNIENDEEALKLGNLIKDRITNKINHGEFKRLLDNTRSQNSAGLDKRVVRKIAKELDLFLIISYGVIKNEEITQKDSTQKLDM